MNPPANGRSHYGIRHARRLVRQGFAKFDEVGRLVWLADPRILPQSGAPKHHRVRGQVSLLVTEASGFDAFPGRAVCPPSGEWLAKRFSGHRERGPLRAPLAIPHVWNEVASEN